MDILYSLVRVVPRPYPAFQCRTLKTCNILIERATLKNWVGPGDEVTASYRWVVSRKTVLSHGQFFPVQLHLVVAHFRAESLAKSLLPLPSPGAHSSHCDNIAPRYLLGPCTSSIGWAWMISSSSRRNPRHVYVLFACMQKDARKALLQTCSCRMEDCIMASSKSTEQSLYHYNLGSRCHICV